MKVNLIFFAIDYETKSFVHVLFYPETLKLTQEEDVSRSLRIAWIRPDPIGSDRKPQI